MTVSERTRRFAVLAVWLVVAVPGVIQLGLLVFTMVARLPYPYDLEWMEGGLLSHAQRIRDGQGLYVPPSVDFIPYLYTPLYPGLLAVLAKLFGLSYTLGRAISVASALAIAAMAAWAILREDGGPRRPEAMCGALLACGLWAAAYPFMDGWYDLVRADTLFLAMVIGGLLGVRAWADEPGRRGLARLALAAAVLALSFFCKQTGVLFVAIGGVLLLVLRWRRVPLYVAVTATIGLGGAALLQRVTGGWFWTYAYQVHQAHDFNIQRVRESFGFILWQFPAMTIAIGLALVLVAASAIANRRRPEGSAALLVWAPIFVAATAIGALSWGTMWAHFNAYMPAMATGAIAAGAAVPAAVGALHSFGPLPRRATAAGLALAATVAVQLALAMWKPARFIPTGRDWQAGAALIARIRDVPGEVFIPYHPWYAHLAGKRMYTHRMGILDMTYGGKWRVDGLREAMQSHHFDLVILDNRDVREMTGLRESYRRIDPLPKDQRPFVYSGAGMRHKPGEASLFPFQLWVPKQ